jgi:hypothetical protein
MDGKDLINGVFSDAVRRLDALKESVNRTVAGATEVIEHAKAELEACLEAGRIGASQTFLGASVMLVGVSHSQVRPYRQGDDPDIRIIFNGDSQVELHGVKEDIERLYGKRVKAIVLLYTV